MVKMVLHLQNPTDIISINEADPKNSYTTLPAVYSSVSCEDGVISLLQFQVEIHVAPGL